MSPISIATIQLTQFLDARIAELRQTKPFEEIARDVGVREVTLRSLTTGRARLPLDKVSDVAAGLGLDPGELMILALQQFVGRDVLEVILRAGADAYNAEISQSIQGSELLEEAAGLVAVARLGVQQCASAIEKLDALFDQVVARSNASEPEDASG